MSSGNVGIVSTTWPQLVDELAGDPASAAYIVGTIQTMGGAIEVFSAPMLGALSDTIGRKPLLITNTLALGIKSFFQ